MKILQGNTAKHPKWAIVTVGKSKTTKWNNSYRIFNIDQGMKLPKIFLSKTCYAVTPEVAKFPIKYKQYNKIYSCERMKKNYENNEDL